MLSLSSLKAPEKMGLKRKRPAQSLISMALLRASPIQVEGIYRHENQRKNLNATLRKDTATTFCEQIHLSNKGDFHKRLSLSQKDNKESVDADSIQRPPFHPNYPNENVFEAALELFNKRNQVCHRTSSSLSVLQKWVCKGDVRVSFQLCVLCKDVGKFRADMERYYLDVLEVSKYRTILCKGCLGDILYKYVGNSPEDIGEMLQEQNRLLLL